MKAGDIAKLPEGFFRLIESFYGLALPGGAEAWNGHMAGSLDDSVKLVHPSEIVYSSKVECPEDVDCAECAKRFLCDAEREMLDLLAKKEAA